VINIEGAGHYPHVDKPGATAAHIEKALLEIEGVN
jgi:pimeloyl-ACP methyl ester carboxylesterase